MTGRVFAVVGPSGVGKDTLLAGAMTADPGLNWAQRVITRPACAGGEPYEGVSGLEFARRQAAGAFALQWEAHGLRYGVPHAELEPLRRGVDVIFNGSRAALPAALAAFPDLAVIRVTAPSTILAERLLARGRETREEIEARLIRASYDVPEGIPVIDVQNDSSPEIGIARLLAALQRDRG